MYVVEAADLHAVTPGNLPSKYADDTYVNIPASNANTRTIELEHIEAVLFCDGTSRYGVPENLTTG